MKIIIVLLFLGVVGSLVSAIIYMMQDRSGTGRMAWALTWRISLSVLLFVVLLLGHWLGWIEATGMQAIRGI